MPEKNNSGFEDMSLPKNNEVTAEELQGTEEKDESVKITVEQTNVIEKIEIPQEYYDMKAEEEQRKIAEAEAKRVADEQKALEMSQMNLEGSKIMFQAIINLVVYLALLIAMQKVNVMVIYLIPTYMLIISFICAIKDKEKNNQPIGSLFGGILIAIGAFLISMFKEDLSDLLFYYVIAGASIGILGMIISNVITNIVIKKNEIKAVATIGIFIFIASLYGIIFYLSKYQPDIFYKYLTNNPSTVVAETEKEFIIKTLKNRYNETFTCDDGKRIQNIQQKTPTSLRTCKDSKGQEFEVTSIAYNENEVLYVVEDNYINKLLLDGFKEKIQAQLDTITTSTTDIALYPKKGCAFVGDCHDCDEYVEIYSEENDLENMYDYSTKLNLTKQIKMDSKEFVNEYEFKYIIEVSGKFGTLQSSNYEAIINNIINELNKSGLKNKYGFEILIENELAYNKVVYKVIGSATGDEFADYNIIDLNASSKSYKKQ